MGTSETGYPPGAPHSPNVEPRESAPGSLEPANRNRNLNQKVWWENSQHTFRFLFTGSKLTAGITQTQQNSSSASYWCLQVPLWQMATEGEGEGEGEGAQPKRGREGDRERKTERRQDYKTHKPVSLVRMTDLFIPRDMEVTWSLRCVQSVIVSPVTYLCDRRSL